MTPDKKGIIEGFLILSMEEYLDKVNSPDKSMIKRRIKLLNEITSNAKKMKRIEKEKLKFAKKD